MSDTKYLSCAETAKLLRAALKESFPGVKFSVRSSVYAGGASIDVKWMDGPTSKAVDPILSAFKGSYFDGMIDYQGSNYHSLDGAPVRFGSNFVFGERRLTKPMAEAVAAKVAEKYGRCDWAEVHGGEYFGYYVQQAVNGPNVSDAIAEAEAALGAPEAKESQTLARIKFTGDDGYGQGTVGPNGSGGDKAAKASLALREREAALNKPVEQLADELVADIEAATARLLVRIAPGSTVLQ